jgi:hypothetical protein
VGSIHSLSLAAVLGGGRAGAWGEEEARLCWILPSRAPIEEVFSLLISAPGSSFFLELRFLYGTARCTVESGTCGGAVQGLVGAKKEVVRGDFPALLRTLGLIRTTA